MNVPVDTLGCNIQQKNLSEFLPPRLSLPKQLIRKRRHLTHRNTMMTASTPTGRTFTVSLKPGRTSPTRHHERLKLHFLPDRREGTRMAQARAPLVLAVAADEEDDESAQAETEGRAETDADFEEGGG